MFRVGTILLLLGVTCILADPLTVKFHFTCTLQTTVEDVWCGNLTVYEFDSVSANDILKTEEFCHARTEKTLEYSLSPGGDNSPSYEINYSISHNCTFDKNVKCVHPYRPQDVPTSGEQVVVFEQELFQTGETEKCKPVA